MDDFTEVGGIFSFLPAQSDEMEICELRASGELLLKFFVVRKNSIAKMRHIQYIHGRHEFFFKV